MALFKLKTTVGKLNLDKVRREKALKGHIITGEVMVEERLLIARGEASKTNRLL